MASAILTAIYRERFTVIDGRALKALDVEKSWLTIDDYLDYLTCCRRRAKEHGVSLRDFDRHCGSSAGNDRTLTLMCRIPSRPATCAILPW